MQQAAAVKAAAIVLLGIASATRSSHVDAVPLVMIVRPGLDMKDVQSKLTLGSRGARLVEGREGGGRRRGR